ncbi:hypothetical protein EON65_34520 [archaeon]|nr:MAG: hypothetical protein EON65_34520 [archaeon]
MKPKEVQGLVKTFEGTLAAYFSALVQDEVAEGSIAAPLYTHSKIKSFLQGFAHVLHIRPILSTTLGQPSSLEDVLTLLQRSIEKARSKSIGWIPALPVEEEVVTTSPEAVESLPAEVTAAPITPAQVVNEDAESKGGLDLNSLDQKSKERLAVKAEAVGYLIYLLYCDFVTSSSNIPLF